MRVVKYKTELDANKRNILVKESSCNYQCVDSLKKPESIVCMLNELYHLNHLAEENLYLLALDTSCRLCGIFEVAHGCADQCLCRPREVFIRALLCGATNIILAHNHPSGYSAPSKEDILVFNRILEAGKLMGVPLLDNIIIGGDEYYSFREKKHFN